MGSTTLEAMSDFQANEPENLHSTRKTDQHHEKANKHCMITQKHFIVRIEISHDNNFESSFILPLEVADKECDFCVGVVSEEHLGLRDRRHATMESIPPKYLIRDVIKCLLVFIVGHFDKELNRLLSKISIVPINFNTIGLIGDQFEFELAIIVLRNIIYRGKSRRLHVEPRGGIGRRDHTQILIIRTLLILDE